MPILIPWNRNGGIPGVPGWLEHTGVVTQLIREATKGKGDLDVVWLDLANAIGFIPRKLVQTTLDRHHVPGKIKRPHPKLLQEL